ncbi:taste receptor type 1 member 3-like [Mixophyes fleayi]|uniref:taste receptor type 1 member 3-like n=1 Tax=Mixophyes fleayi TaxID=3061075 RepID=UPI003F4DE927
MAEKYPANRSYLSNYRNFLDFRFAIEKINKDPNILPNVTLGYHIYDSCNHAKKAVKSVLQILSGPGRTVPNYFCSGQGKIAGFIGDFVSETTMPIAQLLNVYGYSQISYGATDPMLRDRYSYPYLFSASHNDHIYFSAVLKLLKHFSWNWVGIVFSANDSGYRESSILSSLLNSQGICVEFTAKVADQHTAFDLINIDIQEFKNTKIQDIILKSSASVIIVCGTISFCMAELLQLPDKVGIRQYHHFNLESPKNFMEVLAVSSAMNNSVITEMLIVF